MAALLLLWLGLLTTSPAPAPEPAPVAQVRLGAGDPAGERMFGRALHRRRILRAEKPHPARFDLQRWLRVHGAVLR